MPLNGTGNKIYHQRIISDLLFAIRKKFVKTREKDLEVLPEISIFSLEGYEFAQSGTVKENYNFDLAIVDRDESVIMIIEIEGNKSNKQKIKEKMKDCLENIDTLEEVMSIEYKADDLLFYHYYLENGKLRKEKTSSHCNLLDMNFKTSIVSL